jgi:hypothetical protein
MFLQGYVGQPTNVSMGAGTPFNLRGGQMSDLITSQLQGRFYENVYRGNVFCTGTATVVVLASTHAIGNLTVTGTPIVGVWNPTTSPVNLSILQATLNVTMTSTTATGPGPFYWGVSVGNAGFTLGTAPYSKKTLTATGSFAKGFFGAALTGITNNLVVMCGSALGGGSAQSASFIATAVGMQPQAIGSVENIDGSIIVPPGGLLSLMCAVTPVAHSVSSSLTWAEVPI